MLSKERIENELIKLGVTPPKIFYYDEIDSTNTRAKEYAREGGERECVVFIADSQSGGRGRLGRSFVSNKGAGIYISILSFPDSYGFDGTRVTAESAVKLCSAIESLAECEIGLKWVNDLYLGGKKLAGILVESETDNDGKIAFQVVGMGINVYKNAISEEIYDIATSLEDNCKITFSRSELVAKIIYESLYSKADFIREYRERSIVTGKEVRVIKPLSVYGARVLGILDDYSLLVERDGKSERLFSGEISIRFY